MLKNISENGLIFNSLALLKGSVDFRYRRGAFRGAGGGPPRCKAPVGSHLSR